MKTYLGVVVIVVVDVGVGVLFVQGGADLARVGLSLFDGAQVELLTLELKGDVFNLPHGGALGRRHKSHAAQSKRKEEHFSGIVQLVN